MNFSEHYPITAEQARHSLQDGPALPVPGLPDLTPLQQQPEPYRASAVINQPLWHAAVIFGFQRIQVLYLKTICELTTFSSYSDLANKLLENAKGDLNLYSYLHDEFKNRGLSIVN